VERVFTGLFTAELVLKVVAFGLRGKQGLLTNAWFRFDFIIVLIR
jgi:hypothetical protein